MPGLYINLPNGGKLVVEGTETEPSPIEGLQKLVPALVSNSSGGWVCAASGEYSEGGVVAAAHKAYNRVVSGNWADHWNGGGTYPQWNSLQSPAPMTVKAYTLQIRKFANTLYPGTWSIQGLDGSTWVDIPWIDKFGVVRANLAGVTWKNAEIKAFKIASPTPYSNHRIYVTGGGVQCEVAELDYYG